MNAVHDVLPAFADSFGEAGSPAKSDSIEREESADVSGTCRMDQVLRESAKWISAVAVLANRRLTHHTSLRRRGVAIAHLR
jgi:hypothetical protein